MVFFKKGIEHICFHENGLPWSQEKGIEVDHLVMGMVGMGTEGVAGEIRGDRRAVWLVVNGKEEIGGRGFSLGSLQHVIRYG